MYPGLFPHAISGKRESARATTRRNTGAAVREDARTATASWQREQIVATELFEVFLGQLGDGTKEVEPETAAFVKTDCRHTGRPQPGRGFAHLTLVEERDHSLPSFYRQRRHSWS